MAEIVAPRSLLAHRRRMAGAAVDAMIRTLPTWTSPAYAVCYGRLYNSWGRVN
jgi:hypothetical protein